MPQSAKSPSTNRNDLPNSCWSNRARALASGSRSIASNRPPGWIRRRISRACPPPPKVPSKKTAPGLGWRISIDACKSTGTCCGVDRRGESLAGARPLVRDLVGEAGEVCGRGLEGPPALLTPDLDDIVGPRDYGCAGDAGGFAQTRRDEHAGLRIELELVGLGEETAGQISFGGSGGGTHTVDAHHFVPLAGPIHTQRAVGT